MAQTSSERLWQHEIDDFARKIEVTRTNVSSHAVARALSQEAWQALLASHAGTHETLRKHPSLLGHLVEELWLDVDVFMYEIGRWLASQPVRPERL